MEEKKISRENWKSSFEKWEKIVEKTRNREKFYNHEFSDGFADLRVVASCGYCKEFKSGCIDCTLFKKNVCYSLKIYRVLFWQYVYEMKKYYNINWDKALSLATQIRDAIKEDEPKE